MATTPSVRVAGINFDHMHMGDLLAMCHRHPEVEIVGVCDDKPERMAWSVHQFGIPQDRVYTDVDQCLERTRPDFVILCPAASRHADYVERCAPYGAHLFVEKPFASSLADADRMMAAATRHRLLLAINWPLRWYPAHVTAHRLLTEGLIGDLREVHYYDGNRGPCYHREAKIKVEPTAEEKRQSWFYQKALGGGSLIDYLGYGTTLGTWYHGGRKPTEVTAVTDHSPGLEVDEHSITVARYDVGLSKFETRWGTFSDPWEMQPQPKCGFVLKGSAGTISSYDFEPTVRVQTHDRPQGYDLPVDSLAAPLSDPIQYFVHCLRSGSPVEGPLSPAIARIGQQIVDSALLSAQLKKTVPLVG